MPTLAQRLAAAAVTAGLLLLPSRARAQAAPPGAHEDAAFDFMNLLSQQGLHDLDDERWNAYGQFTYISSWKPSFSAAYTNVGGSTRSLIPESERSFTGSLPPPATNSDSIAFTCIHICPLSSTAPRA